MPSDYNGWTNYATWNVVLWIDNEEPSYNKKIAWLKQFRGRIDARLAEEIAEDCLGGRATPDLADRADKGHCWQDVDWVQIAACWSEEFEEG